MCHQCATQPTFYFLRFFSIDYLCQRARQPPTKSDLGGTHTGAVCVPPRASDASRPVVGPWPAHRVNPIVFLRFVSAFFLS